MARYITQQLFNMCAVSAAKVCAASSKPLAEVAAQLADTYSASYDDESLDREITEAAEEVVKFVQKVLPPSTLVGNLTQLQFCIKNFRPSGKRWPMRLFGGTLFNKCRQPISDKVKQCLAVIAHPFSTSRRSA